MLRVTVTIPNRGTVFDDVLPTGQARAIAEAAARDYPGATIEVVPA